MKRQRDRRTEAARRAVQNGVVVGQDWPERLGERGVGTGANTLGGKGPARFRSLSMVTR